MLLSRGLYKVLIYWIEFIKAEDYPSVPFGLFSTNIYHVLSDWPKLSKLMSPPFFITCTFAFFNKPLKLEFIPSLMVIQT